MTIVRKIKGTYQLFRVELSFAAGICVVAGELLGIGSQSSFYEILLGFVSVFFYLWFFVHKRLKKWSDIYS
jgi:hypothetical protein